MRMKFAYILTAAVAMSVSPAIAQDDTASMRAEIDALNERLDSMEAEQDSTSSWTDHIKIKGDIRARFEHVEKDGGTSKSRLRGRARVGVYADVNDQVYAGVRIATGSDESPTSTNQSLENFANKRAIWLDLMYMGYKPNAVKGLDVILGKMKQPWEQVSDLMYDSDVNPEGLNAGYGREYDSFSWVANLGYFTWQDSASDNPVTDITMTAAQLAGTVDLGDNLELTAGANAFFYRNVQDAQVPNDDDGDHLSKGNSTTDNGPAADGSDLYNWDYDYELVEGFVQLDLDAGAVPFKVYGDYIVNTASGVEENTAWLVGAGTGYKRFGLDYNYRDIEADAIIGVLADSDFAGGGTGGKGHKIKMKYKLLKNWSAGLTYFMAEDASGVDVNTLQFDLVVKF